MIHYFMLDPNDKRVLTVQRQEKICESLNLLVFCISFVFMYDRLINRMLMSSSDVFRPVVVIIFLSPPAL